MIVEIKYEGKLYETIEVNNAYVLGLTFKNKTKQTQTLDGNHDSDKRYTYLGRVLPNGVLIKLLIIKIDEEIIKKYKGLTTLSIVSDNLDVVATL